MTPSSVRAARSSGIDAVLRSEALRGLRGSPKALPPKLFYDERGARLFEKICERPEYYLTRAETEILEVNAAEIAELSGERTALVEYGSGAGAKVRLLLNALKNPVAYVPVDISREQLSRVARTLEREYRSLEVHPVWADYTRSFELPRLPKGARPVAFFPGSSIGNFHPPEAIKFLQRIRQLVGRCGALLLGADRRKGAAVLDAAYNDSAGVTAEFNLNALVRLNRELDADFDLTRFRHLAYFNEEAGRVEMHLESRGKQTVHVAGERFEFADGERIWTESSYKYDVEFLAALAGAAGFEIQRVWTDERELFWVVFLTAQFRASRRTLEEGRVPGAGG